MLVFDLLATLLLLHVGAISSQRTGLDVAGGFSGLPERDVEPLWMTVGDTFTSVWMDDSGGFICIRLTSMMCSTHEG